MIKCSLSDRAVQHSLRRLVDDGHITRVEKPGIGVDFWVHPVKVGNPPVPENTRDRASGVSEVRGESVSDTPEGSRDRPERRSHKS